MLTRKPEVTTGKFWTGVDCWPKWMAMSGFFVNWPDCSSPIVLRCCRLYESPLLTGT